MYLDAKGLIVQEDGDAGDCLAREGFWYTGTFFNLEQHIIACGFRNLPQPLSYIFWGVVKNFSRFPNNDIAFLQDYGRFIRAFGLWYLYLFLFICDLNIVVNSIIRTVTSYFDTTNQYIGDDINHIADLTQAQHKYPTPFSWLARKIFKLRREGIVYSLQIYFAASTKANIEFISLWTPIVLGF